MKKLLLAITTFLCGVTGMHAQSFTVSLTPEHQTVIANEKVSCEITITPIDGFSATTNITVTSPSIWIPDYYYPHIINAPYAPAKFDVPTPYSALGTNMVIVEAKSGPVLVRDTCYIEVVTGIRSAGWTYLTPGISDNPDYTITRMAVDRNNVGWIVTSKGIARYDKTNWTFITPPWPNPSPVSIQIDAFNRVVVAQGKSIGRYNGSSWEVISVPDEFVGDNGIAAFGTQGGDTIWVSVNIKGVSRYDGRSWTNFSVANGGLPPSGIISFHPGANGTLWAGVGNSIGSFDGKFWTLRAIAEYGLPANAKVHKFQRAPDGALWAISAAGAVVVEGPAHPPIIYKDVVGEILTTGMSGMTFDAQGRPWIVPAYSSSSQTPVGLFYFDNGTWRRLTMQNSGISDNKLYHAIIDGEGTLWISTHSSGVALVNISRFAGVTDNRSNSSNTILISTTPNPIKDQGVAVLRIPSRGHVRMALYDVLGEEVERFVDREVEAGELVVPVDLSGVALGAYMLRVTAGSVSEMEWVVK